MRVLYAEVKQMGQIKTAHPFYATPAWRQKRRYILLRDRHLCQCCLRQGKMTKATTVHHKQHFDRRPDLGLVDSNLESLCRVCHEAEHDNRKQQKPIPQGVRVIKA